MMTMTFAIVLQMMLTLIPCVGNIQVVKDIGDNLLEEMLADQFRGELGLVDSLWPTVDSTLLNSSDICPRLSILLTLNAQADKTT